MAGLANAVLLLLTWTLLGGGLGLLWWLLACADNCGSRSAFAAIPERDEQLHRSPPVRVFAVVGAPSEGYTLLEITDVDTHWSAGD